MAFSLPMGPNYVYVVIRLKMEEIINSLVDTALLCHYEETNDFFPIGGLVQLGETFKVQLFDIAAISWISALSRTIAYI